MGRIVIACYRPKPGQREGLRQLVRDHVATLRSRRLVTDRPPITMEGSDGTVVEVFEWVSPASIEAAHQDPSVQEMWGRFNEVCDYIPVSQVAEASLMFSEFSPLEGVRRRLPKRAASKSRKRPTTRSARARKGAARTRRR
jgi:hypothetical protein